MHQLAMLCWLRGDYHGICFLSFTSKVNLQGLAIGDIKTLGLSNCLLHLFNCPIMLTSFSLVVSEKSTMAV